jgi:hypothetical protein
MKKEKNCSAEKLWLSLGGSPFSYLWSLGGSLLAARLATPLTRPRILQGPRCCWTGEE